MKKSISKVLIKLGGPSWLSQSEIFIINLIKDGSRLKITINCILNVCFVILKNNTNITTLFYEFEK